MAGVSDYSKQICERDFLDTNADEKKSKLTDIKAIKKMFGKEPLTAEQFGIYLGDCKISRKPISDKTIKRYIKKLCEMSNGKLEVSEFMETENKKNTYIIKPEFHELLITLFDTDFFGVKGKSKVGVDVEQQLRAQLAKNVEIYLNDEIRKQVKSSPQFLNARLEAILSEKINNEIRGMLATMYDADDTIQYQLMLETMDRLVAIRRWMNEWNERIKLIKKEFAKTEQEKNDAKNNNGLFKHKQLQDILIDILIFISKNKKEDKKYEYVTENEEIFYSTLYAAWKMYDITAMPGNELTMWLEQVEKNISNTLRYQCIRKKSRMVFDENDYLEGKILESIDKIARTQLVSNEADMSPEQYERLIRFMGNSSVTEKEDILCKLEQSGDFSLNEKTLKEIIDIKDAVKRRKELGLL